MHGIEGLRCAHRTHQAAAPATACNFRGDAKGWPAVRSSGRPHDTGVAGRRRQPIHQAGTQAPATKNALVAPRSLPSSPLKDQVQPPRHRLVRKPRPTDRACPSQGWPASSGPVEKVPGGHNTNHRPATTDNAPRAQGTGTLLTFRLRQRVPEARSGIPGDLPDQYAAVGDPSPRGAVRGECLLQGATAPAPKFSPIPDRDAGRQRQAR